MVCRGHEGDGLNSADLSASGLIKRLHLIGSQFESCGNLYWGASLCVKSLKSKSLRATTQEESLSNEHVIGAGVCLQHVFLIVPQLNTFPAGLSRLCEEKQKYILS